MEYLPRKNPLDTLNAYADKLEETVEQFEEGLLQHIAKEAARYARHHCTDLTKGIHSPEDVCRDLAQFYWVNQQDIANPVVGGLIGTVSTDFASDAGISFDEANKIWNEECLSQQETRQQSSYAETRRENLTILE